jgi:hypothetical protein
MPTNLTQNRVLTLLILFAATQVQTLPSSVRTFYSGLSWTLEHPFKGK